MGNSEICASSDKDFSTPKSDHLTVIDNPNMSVCDAIRFTYLVTKFIEAATYGPDAFTRDSKIPKKKVTHKAVLLNAADVVYIMKMALNEDLPIELASRILELGHLFGNLGISLKPDGSIEGYRIFNRGEIKNSDF